MKINVRKNRIIVLCLSIVCIAALYMDNKASAFPFWTINDNGEERTFELFAQRREKQFASSDFSGAMKAAGKKISAEGSGSYSVDTGVDHILSVWCGFFPFMFATCEVTSSSLGVYVMTSDDRVLQKF